MLKKKQKQALRQSTPAELQKKLVSLEVDAATKRNEMKLGRVKDLKSVKKIKNEIAVIHTILKEKELASQSEVNK